MAIFSSHVSLPEGMFTNLAIELGPHPLVICWESTTNQGYSGWD